MKMMKVGMFGRIVLAILGGVALGFLLMHAGKRAQPVREYMH